MKKLFILLFSLLISFNSFGEENWVPTTATSDATFYVNSDSIKEDGEYVYWWQMRDYSNQDGNGYMSDQSYIQGDCGVFRFKYLSLILYEQPMGKGTGETFNPPNPEWYYPVPETIEAVLLDEVCKLVE